MNGHADISTLPKNVRKKLKQQGGINIETFQQENPFDALRPGGLRKPVAEVQKQPRQPPAPVDHTEHLNEEFGSTNGTVHVSAPAGTLLASSRPAQTAEEAVIDIVSRRGHEEFLIKFFIAKLRDLGMEPQPTTEYIGLLSDAIRSNPRPAARAAPVSTPISMPEPQPPSVYPTQLVQPVMPQIIYTPNGPVSLASFPMQMFQAFPSMPARPVVAGIPGGSLLAQAQLRQQQVRAQGGALAPAVVPAAPVVPPPSVQSHTRNVEDDFLSRFGDMSSSTPPAAALPQPTLAPAAAVPIAFPALQASSAASTVASVQPRRTSVNSLASSVTSSESVASWSEDDWDDEKTVLRRRQEESMRALQASFLSNFSLDEFEDDDTLCTLCCMRPQNARILDCAHDEFCFDCMEAWFRKEKTCPKCRAPVRHVEKTDKRRKHKPKVKKKKPITIHRPDVKAAFKVEEPQLRFERREPAAEDSDSDDAADQAEDDGTEGAVDPEEIKRIQAQEEQLRQQRALEKQQRKKQLKQAEEEKKQWKQMQKEQFKPKKQAEPPSAAKKLTVPSIKKDNKPNGVSTSAKEALSATSSVQVQAAQRLAVVSHFSPIPFQSCWLRCAYGHGLHSIAECCERSTRR
eukprot:TRINITY_DN5591_c0_g1_i2.p1 TRINITY_DN5591_c0_g1~~TRINITY_DN5591_c0_g1_i2.p1  ORF type:complete len:628 (+),score=95.26 TRINITY_DN5591_c0_g1_i2:255-2138(+)